MIITIFILALKCLLITFLCQNLTLTAPRTDVFTSPEDVSNKPSVCGAFKCLAMNNKRKHVVYPGQKIHSLTVAKEIAIIDKKGGKFRSVICQCDCGNITQVAVGDIFKKHPIKSCGCQQHKIKHGMAGSPIYNLWAALKYRTLNENNTAYHNYGERGISVCDEWLEFIPFYNWSVINGYKQGLTIDRIDNDKGYSPSNCRWVTRVIQGNNKRNNHIIEYNGEKMTMSNFCKKYNLSYHKFKKRIYRGKSVEEAIINCQSFQPRGSVNYFGVRRDRKRFMASITTNYKTKFLGRFNTAEEAAKAYDEVAKKYHGEFANLNFK